MMKMSGRVTGCCVALLLTSVSAVKWINSINDLKEIKFGHSVPEHTLLLLHWFANVVDIDSNNIIRLTFDPNRGDYGSHHYGNHERLLDPLPAGHQYYTVGNLNGYTSEQLPNYVVHPRTEYDGRNRDRIIFRVRELNTGWQNSRSIDQVYITQHYEASEQQGTRYDPEHTYRVSNNLLREIREFSVGENQRSLTYLRDSFISTMDDFQLQDIRNSWGELACLGLLLFIVIKEKYSSNKHNNRNTKPDFVVNIPENRQNHSNGDTIETCTIVLVVFLLLFYLFWYFFIRQGR